MLKLTAVLASVSHQLQFPVVLAYIVVHNAETWNIHCPNQKGERLRGSWYFQVGHLQYFESISLLYFLIPSVA